MIQVMGFNSDVIVYDNTPWRPGRDLDPKDSEAAEDERRLKNLATRVMSNGVEVLVKEKHGNNDNNDKKRIKRTHRKSSRHITRSKTNRSLLSSAVTTYTNIYPTNTKLALQKHNFIIKTCLTTFTYLTTVLHNKKSAVSTFETTISVVTTESLANVLATDLFPEIKPSRMQFMEVKTIEPSPVENVIFKSNLPKIEKRVDNEGENIQFDLIQPSEQGLSPCLSSCCHQQTEGLKTNNEFAALKKYPSKTHHGPTKIDIRPTNKQSFEKNTPHNPYQYEVNQPMAPSDKIVEKYTEVVNEYSDEKNKKPVRENELLTNEQAPGPPKNTKVGTKTNKTKTEKHPRPNHNKFVVADLLKLGTLGIKGLSQLAPVFEKMTGGLIKRHDANKTTTTTSTQKTVTDLTAYNVNKRIDSDVESKHNNFPIYIPVDEMETSESQRVFTNVTLHQNLAYLSDHKNPKAKLMPPKMVHESPLVNGGIPISPGEVITANSDVIVGKPAVGGPLTLAASGMKFQNSINLPPIDSFVSSNEPYETREPPPKKPNQAPKVDDSYDLRPPNEPKPKAVHKVRPPQPPKIHSHSSSNPHPTEFHRYPVRPTSVQQQNYIDTLMKLDQIKASSIMNNHGRPAFLDYIPSLGKQPNSDKSQSHEYIPLSESKDEMEIPDNSPSSSEIVGSRVHINGNNIRSSHDNKPLLVDIQPSKVANVLIPHGSSTALIFAGSSEPHKTGDYVDDPLPYAEPGYFGSFSIDAPQSTNVHTTPNENPMQTKPKLSIDQYNTVQVKGQPSRNNPKQKWKDNKRPHNYGRLPAPTSNQETHLQIGPHITVYNPDIYQPNGNGEFEKYNTNRNKEKLHKDPKLIDKDYENYLAVPPPPPKRQNHQDYNYDRNKFAGQKPVVHTKPIQDMKVFLNIQHPVPSPPLVMNQGEVPPKVTSEVYFASQRPTNPVDTPYTIHIPSKPKPQNNYWHQGSNPDNNVQHFTSSQNNPTNGFNAMPSHNNNVNTNYVKETNNDENMYTITLNTATNVDSNSNAGSGQIIGSSMPVAVGNYDNTNANIPVSTNFAITVGENPNLLTEQSETKHIQYGQKQITDNIKTEDNRWNVSSMSENVIQGANVVYEEHYKQTASTQAPNLVAVNTPFVSINSHANFPSLNQFNIEKENIKPVTEYVQDIKQETQKPSKFANSADTNSHGWYSTLPFDKVKNNNLDYSSKDLPHSSSNLNDAEKSNQDHWNNNAVLNANLGKPFSKPQNSQSSNAFFSANYIPHNYNVNKQPVYDIPVRDNSDETTTVKETTTTEKQSVIYENTDEVYDGKQDSEQDLEGEVSQESMKIPVVSNSEKPYNTINRETNESTKSKAPAENGNTKTNQIIPKAPQNEFIKTTQTEKPFNEGNYNKTQYHSNDMKPIYDHNSHMRPKPFAAESDFLDHQLHQPHLQINQLIENPNNMANDDQSESIDLNIGEEISTSKTTKLTTQKIPTRPQVFENKYKKINRPIFSLKNNSMSHNQSNIITSTIQITDTKPLHVIDNNVDYPSTLPTFAIKTNNYDLNHSSSEIIDLSPPPPTIDYNFKPTTKEETIMGMSPPPPDNPMAPSRPTRPPITPKPIPVRTPPPYRTKNTRTPAPRIPPQRPTRKPITREEISTYRPVFDFNNVKKPNYHRDAPSSHLMPPPRDLPSRLSQSHDTIPTLMPQNVPNIIFPTPISSGWLTSSDGDFAPIEFKPTSIQFPTSPSYVPHYPVTTEGNSDKLSDTKENNLSTEKSNEITDSKESSSEIKETIQSASDESSESSLPSSTEDYSEGKIKVIPMRNKNRTRKPYPFREDILKANSSNKFKVQPKPSIVIHPTRTQNHANTIYSTRHFPTRKPLKPLPSKLPAISEKPSTIEGSETFIDDSYFKPTEVITEKLPSLASASEDKAIVKQTPILSDSTILHNNFNVSINVKPTQIDDKKADNEIVPTKTEYKTTVVTLTKTLFEPPQTSFSYINHTMTVTKTQTSLVSQSEGASTQTLVLTNTYMSTIVDVVTEIQTQIQPTTIVETVTKHIPIPHVVPTPVKELSAKTKLALDDVTLSSEETDNFIIRDEPTTQNVQKVDHHTERENDTFLIVMNKSQNGGSAIPVPEIETSDYDGITRNEEVTNNGVSQVLFGEILLAGAPYLETTNDVQSINLGFGKECQPDCKASRNERCQRIDGMMKCVCRPGFARMFPDRPCKPTYTYSVKLALSSQGKEKLRFHENLSDNSSKQYHALALATHEGINRMIMQSDLRDVYHGVHITGFQPVDVRTNNRRGGYQGVMNNFYVQLSDNAHESRLKEVIEKYLRNNNYSLGGTDVYAAGELVDRLDVTDYDECKSGNFNDCSEHAQCFNLRGTYTCSCLEGFADLSVNSLYPGRICSSESVGCELCNYHGSCYSRDDQRTLCECFQWYAGATCHINLKVVLISLVTTGALLTIVLVICAVVACHKRPRPQQQRSIVACIQGMPGIHQSGVPSKQRADRRALINERTDSGDASSLQNVSLPYIPAKKTSNTKKIVMSDPPAHEPPPPPPAPAVMIPRARLHPTHRDSREMASRKQSMEVCSEAKLISYLESGGNPNNEEMMMIRKHSADSSSYGGQKERHNKQGALVSAGFKVSTTIRHEEMCRDDMSSLHKNEMDAEMERYDSLRQKYSREDISEWTDAERRLGELTLSEARSVGGTLPASTGRAASSTRLTHQEANTMAERDLGSTFLLPHVHLYKPDVTSDVSEFDSL